MSAVESRRHAAGTAEGRTRTRLRFALAVAALVGLVAVFVYGLAAMLLQVLPPAEGATLRRALGEHAGLALLLLAFLAVLLGFIVAAFFRKYVQAMNRFADDVRIVLSANPAHRLDVEGPSEAAGLARAVNALADQHAALQGEFDARVREARADIELERHRLAALMSELAEGVLVCNGDGLILLYNARARRLFEPADGAAAASATGLVGLGRSVFGVIDRELIAHALEIVGTQRRQGEARPVARFVTPAPEGRMLQAQMAPVTGDAAGQPGVAGFVLTLADATTAIVGGSQRDALIETLAGETRAGLASIRAAIEAIVEFDAMPVPRRDQFIGIIRDEAVRLSERLDASLAGEAAAQPLRWPLQEMRGDHFLDVLARGIARQGGIETQRVDRGAGTWVSVDSFALVRALSQLAARLHRSLAVRALELELVPAGRYLRLTLRWRGPAEDAATVAAWDAEPFVPDGADGALTLRRVALRHGGEQWTRFERDRGTVAYCMLLPAAQPAPVSIPATPDPGRPEFYDFDLFSRPGQTPELGARALAELSYTVFDTETTGLEPSAGDEIVSISAVRIVNGRLLHREIFDQLVDPRRAVPHASTAIHGITAEMLRGQPTIDTVLPRFARFAEDTVLVGHNVAFDMRFLELKEAATGVRFLQPVLDTLLLSAVVHAGIEEHALEASARRFGIPVLGRHTSLGDAMVTGEIFIRLVPLLARAGIVTLADAISASRRTYQSRLTY